MFIPCGITPPALASVKHSIPAIFPLLSVARSLASKNWRPCYPKNAYPALLSTRQHEFQLSYVYPIWCVLWPHVSGIPGAVQLFSVHCAPLCADCKKDLRYNTISSIEFSAFSGLYSLKSLPFPPKCIFRRLHPRLIMAYNYMTSVPSDAFSDLVSLVSLVQRSPCGASLATPRLFPSETSASTASRLSSPAHSLVSHD